MQLEKENVHCSVREHQRISGSLFPIVIITTIILMGVRFSASKASCWSVNVSWRHRHPRCSGQYQPDASSSRKIRSMGNKSINQSNNQLPSSPDSFADPLSQNVETTVTNIDQHWSNWSSFSFFVLLHVKCGSERDAGWWPVVKVRLVQCRNLPGIWSRPRSLSPNPSSSVIVVKLSTCCCWQLSSDLGDPTMISSLAHLCKTRL